MTEWNMTDTQPTLGQPDAQGRVSLTLKSDGAFDSPWYVIHGTDASDVLRQLTDPKLVELLTAATNVSTNWSVVHMKAKGLEAVPQQAGQRPAAAAQPAAPATQPGGPSPTCEHGPREWKDFTSRAGNHVKGWFCTLRNSDCKPMYSK